MKTNTEQEHKKDSVSGYATVNGLKMYYEIHGTGTPLVLLHGGGSTIRTTFGRVLEALAQNRQVIAVELQGHGHTADRDSPLTFEQDADDVAALLAQLKITKADFFGFSNGGNTAMQIAIRHPGLVNKLVVASAFYKKSALAPPLIEAFKTASHETMPAVLRDEYKRVAPNPDALPVLVPKLMKRLLEYKDVPEKDIRAIQSPAFIMSANNDVVSPEHTTEMYRLFGNARLAIFPGGHGEYIGEATTTPKSKLIPAAVVAMIEEFLNDPTNQ